MGLEFDILTPGLEEQIEDLDNYPQIVQRHLMRAMHASVELVRKAARKEAPVATGRLSRSIGAETKAMVGKDVKGIVRADVHYAPYVEFGTRPHWPPPRPIQLWVMKKLNVAQDQIRAVAFMVARAISRRGTRANRFMQRAFRQTKPMVMTQFKNAVVKIIDELER